MRITTVAAVAGIGAGVALAVVIDRSSIAPSRPPQVAAPAAAAGAPAPGRSDLFVPPLDLSTGQKFQAGGSGSVFLFPDFDPSWQCVTKWLYQYVPNGDGTYHVEPQYDDNGQPVLNPAWPLMQR